MGTTVTRTPRNPIMDLPEVGITPVKDIDATVTVVGSKSYTNRFLAIAGLASEPTILRHALHSQDTLLLAQALRAFGHVDVEADADNEMFSVVPNGRPMRAPDAGIDMGNAGTPIRFLITMAALAEGRTILTGNKRMRERPMGHLLEALDALGAEVKSTEGNGSPPIEINGGTLRGGFTRVDGTVSSQFTSSLLISAVGTELGIELAVVGDLVSKPYVDMTVAAMNTAGVSLWRSGYERYAIAGAARYKGRDITVEPDASGMSYFLSAAAITGGRVTIPGINSNSVQGDVGLVDAFVNMGCSSDSDSDSDVTLTGGPLTGIDIDMSNMPDVAPTLAVVAAYARGNTRITGIGNLRVKECDRIDAVSTELRKMGVTVDTTEDTMTIHGGKEPEGAVIDTYDDHRIAMAFAVAGLRTSGVVIRDPGCVTKSFPDFWDRFESLRGAR